MTNARMAVAETATLLWRAASSPRRFYRWLDAQPPHLVRASGVAYGAMVALGLGCALGFARATASDAPLLLAVLGVAGASALFLYGWAFGSIFLQRPGALDGRTWEVSGWSWAPALFGSLSLLLPLWVFPVPALALLLGGVWLWHLRVLSVGLSVFLERPAGGIATLYALFIYLLPLALLGFVVWFSVQFL
jgi:hypothetical protein